MFYFIFILEKSEAAKNGGCFEADSIVYDIKHGPKSIKDVHLGDKILSMGADGHYEYSEVAFFLDYDPEVDRLYYEFETESGNKITMTPSHLIFVSTDNQAETMKADYAKYVTIGNYVNVRSSDNTSSQLEKIVAITTRLGHGAYAPATLNGNIVVNNITASCYAVIHNERMVHYFFLPLRWSYNFISLGDRLSSALGQSSSDVNSIDSVRSKRSTDSPQLGIHWYARLLYSTFRGMIPSTLIYN